MQCVPALCGEHPRRKGYSLTPLPTPLPGALSPQAQWAPKLQQSAHFGLFCLTGTICWQVRFSQSPKLRTQGSFDVNSSRTHPVSLNDSGLGRSMQFGLWTLQSLQLGTQLVGHAPSADTEATWRPTWASDTGKDHPALLSSLWFRSGLSLGTISSPYFHSSVT